MGNSFGRVLKVGIFGESHGEGIGCFIDGFPVGFSIDWEQINAEMARRAPGNSTISTPRKEADQYEILSGYFEGHTTGAPMTLLIRNTNKRSSDYDILKHTMRPGHADYTGKVKYKGFNDYRGGGHFSGRITAPLTLAGAMARQVLESMGIEIGAHVKEIHGIQDASFSPMGEKKELFHELRKRTLPTLISEKEKEMAEEIQRRRVEGNSVGGIIEVMATGLSIGAGDPFFDSLESEISHMMFSVPAIKGIEFGEGFGFASLTGLEANDPMHYENGVVVHDTNHNGGILGGISNGNPILFRVAVKPTASVGARQHTVNVETKEDTLLSVGGRHDPCIVTRAVPVVENALAFVLLDALMAGGLYGK